MQTKPKSNTIVTSAIPPGTEMMELTVRVPRQMVFTVRDQGDVPFDLSLVSPENHGVALVHGWNQKVPDTAAIGKTDKAGDIIPEAERTRIKFERMNDLVTWFESGTTEWSRKGTGGGGRSIVVEAFARHNECTYEQADERINRRAAQANRTRAQQLAVYRKLLADDIRAIEAERTARAPAFDVEAEMDAMSE